MKALLLVAHGSKRQFSNDEIRTLSAQLKDQVQPRFDYVACAFLELTTPSIAEGIAQCVAAGAERIVVLPYFLSAGKHIAEDIPQIVEAQRARHPNVDIVISDYIGKQPEMSGLLARVALRHE